jgi:hypothetical protein
MKPLKFTLLALLLSPILAHAIVMRHDVPEQEYIAAGGEWPATAYFHLGGRFGNGTGILVAPAWVLTAGHLTHYLKVGDKISINGEEYKASRVITHPDYVLYSPDNDLGMVQLDRTVTGVTPALLYQKDDEAGQIITFVDAGRPGTGETGAMGPSGTTRWAENRIEDTREMLLVFKFMAAMASEIAEMASQFMGVLYAF